MNALEYICRFEEAVAREVRARGFDGVVCGHIHHAAIKTIEACSTLTTATGFESCTALVEDMRGTSGDVSAGHPPAQNSPPPRARFRTHSQQRFPPEAVSMTVDAAPAGPGVRTSSGARAGQGF